MAASSSSAAVSFAIFLNRLSLGLYFAITGYNKVIGLGEWLDKFPQRVPAWLPGWIATPYGYALPFVELVLGVLLVLGLYERVAAGVTALVLLSIIIGYTGVMDPPKPFHTNVILLTLAILLAVTGPGRVSVDSAWRKKR